MTQLARNILFLRKEQGLTQQQIGEKLQTTQRCYASWAQGRTEPNIEMLVKLADIYEVSVDYLLGRSDELGAISIDNGLTDFEKSFLSVLKNLSNTDKYQVLGFAKSLAI